MTKPRSQAELSKFPLEAKHSRKGDTQEQPLSKEAHGLNELTEMGYGCRSFLYVEIAESRLRALKRGRRTIVLTKDLAEWKETLPEAKIVPAKKKAA